MNIPRNKFLFGWQQRSVASGVVAKIIQAAHDLGLSGVSWKVGSGVYSYPFSGSLLELRNAFRSEGLKFFGWHYVYGQNSPVYEASLALRRIEELDLDGYEIDAEGHYKGYSSQQASDLSGRIKEHCEGADIPLGLTTYRFVSTQPTFPWRGFLQHVDYYVPQVYWQPASVNPPRGPVAELNLSIQEWTAEVRKHGFALKPFFPAGRAYIGDGYPTPGPSHQQVVDFWQACRSLGLPGATTWSFDNLYTHSSGSVCYAAIKSVEWKDETPPPNPDPDPGECNCQEEITELNNGLQRAYLMIGNNEVAVSGALGRIESLEAEVEELKNSLNPPDGAIWVRVTDDKLVAMASAGDNDSGYPKIYINVYDKTKDPALKWLTGDKLKVYPERVRADGGKFFHVIHGVNDHGYGNLYADASSIEPV